jgi:hypothetical protein
MVIAPDSAIKINQGGHMCIFNSLNYNDSNIGNDPGILYA